MRRVLVGFGLVALAAGCRSAPVVPLEQPVAFEGADYDAVWDATLATLKDYFPIYTARRESGDVLTQFEITYGLFEFWRDLSVTRRDLWEDTLQTVRRRARAQVERAGDAGATLVLVVEKERRDRAREGARFSFGRSVSIFDPEVNALDRRLRDPTAADWAALGRDARLEAYLLDKIRSRLALE